MDVSVIIPTFSPGFYLYDCLSSLLVQNFDHKRFEILIVLNGERDPFYDDINSFCRDKDIITKLLYTSGKGVSNARNLALANIGSEYVVFLDDDDILSPGYISDLYSRVSSESVVVSNFKTFTTDLTMLGDDYVSKCYEACSNGRRYSLFNYRGFLSSACGKMIPKDIIDKFEFDKSLKYSEDAVFMFAISCNIKDIILSGREAIYYRRLRENSVSQSSLTFFFRFRRMLILLSRYTRAYLSAPSKYNMLFYLSRLAATMKYFVVS
jgi:glycosyltransferase involved in cell wall biosynthesis